MRANVAKKEVRLKPHLFFHKQYWPRMQTDRRAKPDKRQAYWPIALSLATVRQTMHESEMPVAIRA